MSNIPIANGGAAVNSYKNKIKVKYIREKHLIARYEHLQHYTGQLSIFQI